MDLIESVFDISEKFMSLTTPDRLHVNISEEMLLELSETMKEEGIVNFYSEEPQKVDEQNELKIIIRELIASSINYCYWYGHGNIRPMGANSNSMYELVDEAMNITIFPDKCPTVFDVKEIVQYLIELLSINRYPLLEERKRHLLEVADNGFQFAKHTQEKIHGEKHVFEKLIREFQGFASDIFLKRASLFFIQLHRQLGWFDDLIKELFVPADYQVPKMLVYFNILNYSNQLQYKIQEGKLVEKGSLMECQIRAATILACRKLCKLTGWTIADIDTWLWTKRKLPKHEKFHLTLTSDY
jgi:hypothetical protein